MFKSSCKTHQRVKLTDQQIDDRKVPCPVCGQVIRIVPNRAKKRSNALAARAD